MKSKPSSETTNAESLRHHISRLGDEWAEAEKVSDMVFLEAVLADGWHFTSTKGQLISKAQWLKRPRTFPSSVRFDRSDVDVKMFGNTAVLTGIAEIESIQGAGVFRYADVFTFESGRWRAIYSHFTPIHR